MDSDRGSRPSLAPTPLDREARTESEALAQTVRPLKTPPGTVWYLDHDPSPAFRVFPPAPLVAHRTVTTPVRGTYSIRAPLYLFFWVGCHSL
jgi:hypothetical protein